MPSFHRQLAFPLMVATFIVVSAGPIARGQDDVEAEENAAAVRAQELVERRAELQALRLRAAYKAQCDSWLRSQFSTRVGAREQLEMRLTSRLRALDSECRLTAAQVKKLQLAGRGDIKRFMDRVDHIAKTVEDYGSSIDDLRAAVLEMQDLSRPASEQVFGENSLLCKCLVSTLDDDQVAERNKASRHRNMLQYQSAITNAVWTLQRNLALKEEQCTTLTELLLKETAPPLKFGSASNIALVLRQASRIPEEKIRPIFDAEQWRTISRWMAVYFVGASGEKTMEKHGFIFYDEPDISRRHPVKPVSNKDASSELEQNRRD